MYPKKKQHIGRAVLEKVFGSLRYTLIEYPPSAKTQMENKNNQLDSTRIFITIYIQRITTTTEANVDI